MKAFLVEDHPVFLDGLVSLLHAADVEVVGTAGSVQAALAILGDVDSELVLVDIALPDGDGAALIAEIVRRRPDLRVLVLTMFHDDGVLARALEAGADGYLVKDAEPNEIIAAVRAVSGGSFVVGSAMSGVLRGLAVDGVRAGRDVDPTDFPGLRRRERQVLALVADGLDNAAIADRLGLSTKTVANYVSTILTQLQVTSRSAAIELVRARDDQR